MTDPNLQIKTEEDGNFKAEKYKIEIEVNILNTTRWLLVIIHKRCFRVM